MIRTLTGGNSYQITAELHKMITDFIAENGDLAVEKLEGEEASLEQIIGAVEATPFLSARKLVVIRDLSVNKDAVEAFETIINRTNDTTDLILVESKPDKRSAYYKALKKSSEFSEFNELGENEIQNWVVAEAKRHGANLSNSDANYLIQRVGNIQVRLGNEIEKLAQFDPNITRASIDEMTLESPSTTIFNLIDSIFSGNLKQALRIYDDQRKLKVEPQAIHGMLVWQMHAVSIASMAPADVTAAQIAKESSISPYVIQKSQRIAKTMGRQKISQFMKLLRDIDYRSKHETFDYDEALRYAILTLAK